ncbi:NTP transferase domain-containing protein [bacterium]|nr:NTP transferase domain-containing protein [bacterium]
MLQMVVLAGGLGTRLGSLGETTPKSLIRIQGIPFIELQLDLFEAQGIERVLYLVGHLGESIIRHFSGDNYKGMSISFSREPENMLLGTGGALKWAEGLLEEDYFLTYGDSFLPIDYSSVENHYFSNGSFPVMTVFRNSNNFDKSNLTIENGRVVEYSKLGEKEYNYIDYGLSVLNKNNLADFERGMKFDLEVLITKLISSGSLLAYEVFERFYEIGTKQGICSLEDYFDAK